MVDRRTSSRVRRTPEESRREILTAAADALAEIPLAELTVGSLMDRTRLGRSSFYVHFDDIEDLVAAQLRELEEKLWEPASLWVEAAATDRDEQRLHDAVAGVVAVWVEHGPVLRAITEAAMTNPRIRTLWREALMERFVDAVAAGIASTTQGTPSAAPAREVATALLLMNERYLADRLGREPQHDPDEVTATLTTIWAATLH